jgi:hypothetical protein
MISLYGGKSFHRALKTLTSSSALILISALALFALGPICHAESAGSNSGANLGKHARKIHRELSRFKTGSYVHMVFRDGSERTGALDSLDDAAFTVTNAESNNRETHTYDEIAHVTREKYYIGEGSEAHVRHIPLWIPITVGVLAAGAAVTAAEVH